MCIWLWENPSFRVMRDGISGYSLSLRPTFHMGNPLLGGWENHAIHGWENPHPHIKKAVFVYGINKGDNK